jgi:hypothetical protein
MYPHDQAHRNTTSGDKIWKLSSLAIRAKTLPKQRLMIRLRRLRQARLQRVRLQRIHPRADGLASRMETSEHGPARPDPTHWARACHTPALGVWPRLVARSGPDYGQPHKTRETTGLTLSFSRPIYARPQTPCCDDAGSGPRGAQAKPATLERLVLLAHNWCSNTRGSGKTSG